MRSFALGLFYPAILGTLIVMLFVPITNDWYSALKTSQFQLGLLIAAFFSVGFVHSDAVTEDQYCGWHFVFDCTNAILVFLSYSTLGLGNLSPVIESGIGVSWPVFLLLAFISIMPYLRRVVLAGDRSLSDLRNQICFGATLVAVLGLIHSVLCPGQIDATLYVVGLAVALFVYFVDILRKQA